MIIQCDAAHIFNQGPTQRAEIGRLLIVEPEHDQARHGQLIEVEAGAKPWFEKAFGFLS